MLEILLILIISHALLFLAGMLVGSMLLLPAVGRKRRPGYIKIVPPPFNYEVNDIVGGSTSHPMSPPRDPGKPTAW